MKIVHHNTIFMSAFTPLPIEAIKTNFCNTLSEHHTVVLSAPPGAGKSTCLPLWLLELKALSGKKIYLLQPRRLAVKNIATYLASQLNEIVGETVGYRLRNETKVSKNTRLEVITEGILTQIIQHDAELSACALVVFDEFHERSLQGDLAFALARDVQQGLRDDLKILLMSATLDIENITNALSDAKSLISEGCCFSVDITYNAPANSQRWRDHACNVIKHQAQFHQGSILVFLPGVADIRYIAQALADVMIEDLLLCPLHGDLTLKQQQQAIEPCQDGLRKLVLATNIAETSLTIEGVNLVIDCGLEKIAIYDSASLMNKLVQKQIAKASAVQRAGRAGRLMAGKCIRLYAKDEFERRPEQSENEISQADLLPTLIEAARWGVNTLADLPMLELPSTIKEQKSWQELQSLTIVDKQNKLTQHGQEVALFSCHPRFAHMILSARNLSKKTDNNTLTFLACILAALLEERDILSAEQAKFNCDIAHRVDKLISQWHKPYGVLANIVKQIKNLVKRTQLKNIDSLVASALPMEYIGLLLAYAYPERVAKGRGSSGDFICANGKGVVLNEKDALADESFLVIADLMQFRGVLQVSLAASIDLLQIKQVFTGQNAEQIIEQDVAVFDDVTGKIIARTQTKLSALVIQETVNKSTLTTENIAQMWCDLITQRGLGFLNWQNKDLALRNRWQWLTTFFPQYQLPEINDKALLANLGRWFSPFVGEIKSITKLAKLDLSTMLLSQLEYQQQQLLKQAAPTVYIGPTGRHCPITYSEEKSPKVSMPMQELYGSMKTPCVGGINGEQSIPLLLELLSPAKRPIQVTQDLVGFWQGSYKAVQKEMKAQYPKHFWPNDPVNAQPTNKTKRHLKNQN